MENLEIKDIELDPYKGVGKLNIESQEQEIHLRWYEDWDCEAFSDTISVNPLTGNYSHTRYVENNYNARSNNVCDRDDTVRTLKSIAARLSEDSPEYQKAKQTIGELVKLIKT